MVYVQSSMEENRGLHIHVFVIGHTSKLKNKFLKMCFNILILIKYESNRNYEN